MAERKSFLLRIDAELMDRLKRWADDDLRSLNGQIEFLLRGTLRDSGRDSRRVEGEETASDNPPEESPV